MMYCISCKRYCGYEDEICEACYAAVCSTKIELENEIDNLKAKVAFLRFWSSLDHHITHPSTAGAFFTDVVLVASSDDCLTETASSVHVPAHKAVLVSRSPVFRAMFENEMEESRSGTIKISDVSYDALGTFVNYLYTAEACLDEQMAYDLLVLSEKYQVTHLKACCEKFLVSKLNWDNSVVCYTFAHQYNAKHVLDAASSLITDNMDKFTKREEYMELVKKDPWLVVEIYEAYLSKQVNTATRTPK